MRQKKILDLFFKDDEVVFSIEFIMGNYFSIINHFDIHCKQYFSFYKCKNGECARSIIFTFRIFKKQNKLIN
jgi:hypothetical protein